MSASALASSFQTGSSLVEPDSAAGGVRPEVLATGAQANPTAMLTAVGGTYTVGDLVANSTTAASVVHPQLSIGRNAGGSFSLARLRAKKSTTTTGVSIRVHLFRTAPAVATTGDNGVLASVLAGAAAGYLGALDITFDQIFSDGACGIGVPKEGSAIFAKLAPGLSTVHLVVEARSTAIGTAEVFTFEAEALQD